MRVYNGLAWVKREKRSRPGARGRAISRLVKDVKHVQHIERTAFERDHAEALRMNRDFEERREWEAFLGK